MRHSGKSTESDKDESKSRAAASVGMFRPTLAKAQKVVKAAAEEPAKYGDLQVKMGAMGMVNAASKELKRRKREEKYEPRGGQSWCEYTQKRVCGLDTKRGDEDKMKGGDIHGGR